MNETPTALYCIQLSNDLGPVWIALGALAALSVKLSWPLLQKMVDKKTWQEKLRYFYFKKGTKKAFFVVFLSFVYLSLKLGPRQQVSQLLSLNFNRKEKTTPFGVKLMTSQALYQAAQDCQSWVLQGPKSLATLKPGPTKNSSATSTFSTSDLSYPHQSIHSVELW